MVNPWWSWALTGIGLTCLYLMSTGRAWPWLAACFAQSAWITYGFVTHQFGFVVSGCAYAVVQLVGWRKARRRTRTAAVTS
jgi:hypothetical protein